MLSLSYTTTPLLVGRGLAATALFPAFERGESIDFRVPPTPEWHIARGWITGALIDFTAPLPGQVPTRGLHRTIDFHMELEQ